MFTLNLALDMLLCRRQQQLILIANWILKRLRFPAIGNSNNTYTKVYWINHNADGLIILLLALSKLSALKLNPWSAC